MNARLRETLAPARKPCGSLSLRVAGEACVLRCSGALWSAAHRTLVAGDLHLEKGSAFASRGQLLPPYDSRATLAKLEAEIQALNPDIVVLLGDSFHDTRAIRRLPDGDRQQIERLAMGRTWIWLEGNHDLLALAQDAQSLNRLPGETVETMSLGALRLTHEPAQAGQAASSFGEVAGHLHPAVRISAFGRSVRRPCFVTDGHRILLPAFGAYTGGLNVRDPAIASLFENEPLCCALGEDKVHALAWSQAR